MTTITEDYISFETSKLLKEKGFDECIFEFYEGNKIKYAHNGKGFRLSELSSDIYYPHITHQMAMKWLREIYSLHIWIGHNNKKGLPWYYEIHNIKTGMVAKIGGINCGSYETACEEAIKCCLKKLI